jgi:preprotein translocase subunit YajC
MFFISQTYAADLVPEAPNFQNIIGSVVPLLIFVAIFYFLLIRPQQKKQREHEKEVASLKPNDKVLTAGGIYAKVSKIKEKSLVLEIAKGVEIEVLPSTVNLIIEEEKKPSKK